MLFRFKKALKKGGTKYTIVSILIIFLMLIMLRLTAPKKAGAYPEIVYYNSYKYQYSETIKESPLSYTRRRDMRYEGYILLLNRKNKGENPPTVVYIYSGYREYRKYILIK